MKNTIWQFLNSPVIVALLTVLFVVAMFNIGTARLFSPFRADDVQRNKIEALGRQELILVSGVNVPTNAPQKFVGEFRNHSRFIVQSIQGTVCFFDVDGKLIDVISKRLDGVGSVWDSSFCNTEISEKPVDFATGISYVITYG